jgi:hypothetical protein
MSLETSGADYLRRLKQDEEGGLATPAEPAAALPSAPSAVEPERRRSPRYKCEESAEFRVGGTNVRTWGTFTDLSLNGCYVEMTATFPVEAMVDLGLELNGLRAEVRGEVRVSYPFLGIGIAFREVSDENRLRLQEMVRTLLPAARVGVSGSPTVAGSAGTPGSPLVGNPGAALRAVVEFFEARQLLTKEEFLQLLRESQ